MSGDVRGGNCSECDGSGDEMVDSMTLYGIPGGYDVGGPCPACMGSGSGLVEHEIDRLRAVLSALCDATDFASLGLRLGLSGTLARIPAWENDIERIDKARAVAVSVLQGEPEGGI